MVCVDWVLLKNSRKEVTVTLNSEKCCSFLKITCKSFQCWDGESDHVDGEEDEDHPDCLGLQGLGDAGS